MEKVLKNGRELFHDFAPPNLRENVPKVEKRDKSPTQGEAIREKRGTLISVTTCMRGRGGKKKKEKKMCGEYFQENTKKSWPLPRSLLDDDDRGKNIHSGIMLICKGGSRDGT